MYDDVEEFKQHRLVRQWPRLITASAWFWLAYVTANDVSIIDPSFLDSYGWTMGATVVGLVVLTHYFHGGYYFRWAVAFFIIVYALARGFAYASNGIWAPFAVWGIIIGLTLSAYRSSLRGGTDL